VLHFPGRLRALNYYRTHFKDTEHNRENAQQPLTIPVLALVGMVSWGRLSNRECKRSRRM
jgi:hypothetical protein